MNISTLRLIDQATEPQLRATLRAIAEHLQEELWHEALRPRVALAEDLRDIIEAGLE